MDVTREKLRRLVGEILARAEESDEPAVKLSRIVLGEAAERAAQQPNPRRIADLHFALGDLRSAVDDLPFSERQTFDEPMRELATMIDEMRQRTRLPQPLLDHIARLRAKLEARRVAVSRQGFTPPGVTPPPLPHPPESLVAAAEPIRAALRNAGFDTPNLDQLIEQPGSIYMSELADIVDELDVITG